MLRPRTKFTYRDYLLLPEQDRLELIEGELYVIPSPTVRHQRIIARLPLAMREYVESNE
jgi:hypothetical protein